MLINWYQVVAGIKGDFTDLITLLRLTNNAQDTYDKNNLIRQEYTTRTYKLITVFKNVKKAYYRTYSFSNNRKPATVSFY